MTAEGRAPRAPPWSPEQLRALLPPCRQAMREAGAVVLEVYRSAFAVERKGDLTPVTEADRRSDRLLSERLAALPAGSAAALPVLSEEGSLPPFGERRGWRRLWLVDPLDGTKEFVKRSGEFTINVALVEDRAAVLGLVYAPLQDLFYWGGPALGAWRQEAGGEPRPLARAAPRTAGGEPWPLPRRDRASRTRPCEPAGARSASPCACSAAAPSPACASAATCGSCAGWPERSRWC